jgi:lipopolysaccharide/colanic/teichoic acid biosynthesis glycosyltransferase
MFSAVAVGSVLVIFLSYLAGLPPQGRWIFLIYFFLIFAGVTFVRLLYSAVGSVKRYHKRTLIVGCGTSGRAIAELLGNTLNTGLKILGFLDKNKEKQHTRVKGLPVFWQEGDLKEAVEEHKPDVLIIAMRRSRYQDLINDLIWCAQQGIEIWDAPTVFEQFANRIPLRYVDELWLLFSALNRPNYFKLRLKRLGDLIMVVLGLFLSLPIMALTALAIKLDSPGPIMLKQKRIGENGKLINIYKFRSMTNSVPAEKEKGTSSLADHRITRVGKIIRKYHIDEIPQLINVLNGDLSLIGPRTELFAFVNGYIGEELEFSSSKRTNATQAEFKEDPPDDINTIIPYIEQRFTVPQGLTGWAQVMYPFVTSTHEDMIKKLEYDLYYIKNISFALDLRIFIKTVKMIILGRGK